MSEPGEGLPMKKILGRISGLFTGRKPAAPEAPSEGGVLAGKRSTTEIRRETRDLRKKAAARPTPETSQGEPGPGEPGYEPITRNTLSPEPERQAQLRYAAQKARLEQTQTPQASEEPQIEEDVNKPEWLRRQEAANRGAYTRETLQQGPQGSPTPRLSTSESSEPYVSPFESQTNAQTPTAEAQPQVEHVEPFTRPGANIPEKVFEPEPDVPGEHEEVEAFLQKKTGSAGKTTQQPSQPLPGPGKNPLVGDKAA